MEDGSLALGNLMNAAHSLGIASCWIHRAREVFASAEGKALLQQWGVEGEWIGIGHCILGYAAEPEKPAAPRLEAASSASELKIHNYPLAKFLFCGIL